MIDISTLSMEAITLQTNQRFPNQVTELFQKCLDTPDEASMLIQLDKLGQLTGDTTGIQVSFNFIAKQLIAGKYLCSIEPPAMASMNPLRPKMAEVVASLDYTHFVADELIAGTIDLKNVRVTGFYRTIPFKVQFTPQMFDGLLTARELTAVYLHELGHAWTILEFMGQTLITNTILAEAVGRINPDDTYERVFEIGKAAIIMAGGEVPETIEDLHHIVVCVQQGQERRIQSRVNSKFVGERLVERVADQFAARYMAGASLVTAFSKMERKRNFLVSHTGYDPVWVGSIANVMSIISFPYGAVRSTAVKFTVGLIKGYRLSVGGTLLQALAMDGLRAAGQLVEAESPIERSHSIRRELVGFLKNNQLTDEMRRQILLDITTIDLELKNVHKYGDVMGKMFRGLYNKVVGRADGVASATVQESLANNRLHEVSAILKDRV